MIFRSKILIWGVSNVGKTTIGKNLAKRLRVKFYDIDDEIIKKYGSIDLFQKLFPNCYDRFNIKGTIMKDIIKQDNNFIMAVSPIYSPLIIEDILDTNTSSIEIIDTTDAIYDRLVLDGEYKEKHKNHYIREIRHDQTSSYGLLKDINKVDINNQNIENAIEIVYKYLEKNNLIN
ncbi:MAG: shikimate kinase [Bacilli bacterium]